MILLQECILPYGCDTWTLLVETGKRNQGFVKNDSENTSGSPTRNTKPMTMYTSKVKGFVGRQ